MPAVETAGQPHNARGRPTNYRELAGIRARIPRNRPQPLSTPVSTPDPDPDPGQPAAEPQGTTGTPNTLDWVVGYSKCSVFREPYNAAAQQAGENIQYELRNLRYTFRFATPYLPICIQGMRLIHVPQLPEFLTHVVYMHHDHVTAGTTGHDSILVLVDSLSKMAHFVPAKKSFTAADIVNTLGYRLIRYHGFPEARISDCGPRSK
ncbi:hypothetical protein EBH_0038220 [Eimeria brunetti]|uniref:Integrase catalytic domain-containing protein n=1 Tax=Eimeria brunetti TaxID=51314 RepID=U6LR02_9EIME|nr:hypothetical protein EBH_0038220 [Eimeria brunetti]